MQIFEIPAIFKILERYFTDMHTRLSQQKVTTKKLSLQQKKSTSLGAKQKMTKNLLWVLQLAFPYTLF